MKKHYEMPSTNVLNLEIASKILDASGENMYNNNLGPASNIPD